MESRVFTEPDHSKKLAPYPSPLRHVESSAENACSFTADELINRHKKDFSALFGRAHIDFGGVKPDIPTDKLLERYINSRIIYNMMKEEAWIQYLNDDDPAITETLRVMREGKAFPKPTEKK